MPLTDDSLVKTKSFLKEMEFKAAGWEPSAHDPGLAGEALVNLYVFDVPTQWTWACSVGRDEFVAKSSTVPTVASLHTSIREALGTLIQKAADGHKISSIDSLTWEHQLGALLILYAGTTITWEKANRFQEGGNFIVLNYRKPFEIAGRLRPFAQTSFKGILPVLEFESAVKSVIDYDKKSNSSFFN